VVRKVRPNHVVSHWETSIHKDHTAAHAIVKDAVLRSWYALKLAAFPKSEATNQGKESASVPSKSKMSRRYFISLGDLRHEMPHILQRDHPTHQPEAHALTIQQGECRHLLDSPAFGFVLARRFVDIPVLERQA
jgi:LmbE family N-acetylglucosaminyl deacetylase